MSHAHGRRWQSGWRSRNGFTLIEILFVVFIVGLLTSLIAPRFGSRYERMERASQQRDIEDQLLQLPRRVRLLERYTELPKALALADLGDGRPPLVLPPGWTIQFTPPLRIAANGACSSSTVTLGFAAKTVAEPPLTYAIAELTCELSLAQP